MDKNYLNRSEIFQRAAENVLRESGISEVWERAGCRVERVGSMRMGLMGKHRDIDLHVYSKWITEEKSFLIAAEVMKNPAVTEAKCINGLHTDEECMAWHFNYRDKCGELWQVDVIHIEEGSHYDGYFERVADRIREITTSEQKETIIRLKLELSDDEDIHGIEIYEAVICGGVSDISSLRDWLAMNRRQPGDYWMP